MITPYGKESCDEEIAISRRTDCNRVSYRNRAEAQSDVFEYIEVFYNRKRRHGYLGNISPAAFEKWTGGLYETVH